MNQAITGSRAPGSRLFLRIVSGIGAAACFATVVGMLVLNRTADVRPSTSDTVKFANPFDSKEVFEFPAGTSPAEARAKAAELLLQRAQQRAPKS